MNIDTAKHMLKSYSGMTHKMTDNNGRPKLDQAIETILNELEKKDKVIAYNKKETDEVFAFQTETIRKMADFLFHNYYRMTYVDEFQYEERIQKIIGDFEEKVEG